MHEVIAIIVTYNRKELLYSCITALIKQSKACDILIVDNASKDGTKEYLQNRDIFDDKGVHYLRLEKNFGGSGGFHFGIEYCMSHDWQWFWFMDDDAKPEQKALENLLLNAVNPNYIYSSVAIGIDNEKKKLCFPAKSLQREKNATVEYYDSLFDLENVSWVPFLGFFINCHMVQKIGLPDQDFFILDDDVEYSERAKKHGAKIYMVKSSIIYHPYQQTVPINVLGRKVYYRSMPPWKVYFDVRNKIITAKKYYPALLFLQTLPGILIRAFYSVFHESDRLKFFSAYVNGIISGMLNITDKRYLPPISNS